MIVEVNSNNIKIKTKNNLDCHIVIATFLGTTVFEDEITPQNNCIIIKGLNDGKYTIKISNKEQMLKHQIIINTPKILL